MMTQKKEVKKTYNCSMAVFYMVCRFGWKLYLKYQGRFAEFSDAYTKEMGTDALAAINKAQAMPDVSQRRGSVTQQGNELDDSSKAAVLYWKMLRRFIMKVFKVKAEQAAAIAQAGGAHYAAASQGNYSEITSLLTAGQAYINDNAAQLVAEGNMPAGFAAAYGTAKLTYDTEHLDYGETKGDAADGTADKVTANNELHAALMEMFGDADIVFDEEKPVAAQFTFAAVKRLVTRNMAGIHFKVVNGATDKPVEDAVVGTDESTETFAVDKKGVLDLPMKVGTHSITVVTPDFAIYTGVVQVDAGVMHRVIIKLVKEVVTDVVAVKEMAGVTQDE